MTQLRIIALPLATSLASIGSIKPTITPKAKPVDKVELQRRKRFCVFLKVLADHLEAHNPEMRQQLKQLVRHCTKRNRMGDIKFLDLTDALQVRLQSLVGERLWSECHKLADLYLSKRN